MEMIKGETKLIRGTVYSDWTGLVTTSTLANLTGATTKGYLKNRDTDSDAVAVATINGVNIDAVNGEVGVTIPAATTNALSQQKLWFEMVTKLADGSYIRSGAQELVLKPNVGKTLF